MTAIFGIDHEIRRSFQSIFLSIFSVESKNYVMISQENKSFKEMKFYINKDVKVHMLTEK
jgi:hypothetical protein